MNCLRFGTIFSSFQFVCFPLFFQPITSSRPWNRTTYPEMVHIMEGHRCYLLCVKLNNFVWWSIFWDYSAFASNKACGLSLKPILSLTFISSSSGMTKRNTHSCLLCILTSLRVLNAPKRCLKYIFDRFQPILLIFDAFVISHPKTRKNAYKTVFLDTI